jgi:transcriptional regulator with XRE-family HTH domain
MRYMSSMRKQDPMMAHRLRLIRTVLNISELEAASAAGVSKNTWRRWEITGCPGEGIKNFIYAYALSLDWLIRGKADGLERFPIRSRTNVEVLQRQ